VVVAEEPADSDYVLADTDTDTVYVEDEPFYADDYYYDYPPVYSYGYNTYDPWYWNDYYFGLGWYNYGPYWRG